LAERLHVFEWQSHRGEVAYEAFRLACGGVNLATGAQLPAFADLDEIMRGVWIDTAEAVCERFGALGASIA
jgi:hypothetical protein